MLTDCEERHKSRLRHIRLQQTGSSTHNIQEDVTEHRGTFSCPSPAAKHEVKQQARTPPPHGVT